jgi:5-formyltetrahydrofolate cyclo-ligase
VAPPASPSIGEDKRELRRRLRAARRAVGAGERAAAAGAIDRALAGLGLPRPGTRIAAYRPQDGEIDPAAILRRARALGCAIHVPVITSLRGRRMQFMPLGPGGEPAPSGAIGPRWLDLVLVPLVGFDALGNRLGMGAAFYDRHFAFLRQRRAWRRPLLLGLAFEAQRVDGLPVQAHDLPLWGVVTERGIHGRAARTR